MPIPLHKFALATLLVSAVAIPAHAQERSAGGALEAQMTWSALKSLIDNNTAYAEGINARVDQVILCNKKSMGYAPGTTGADTDGCVPISTPPSKMDLVTITESICVNGGKHDVVASCPAGKSLLSCAGGPGDQDESQEYWVLESDFKNGRCIGHVSNPLCYNRPGWYRTVAMATCY